MSSDQLAYFVYCRKSSEDDRQAASIGDQLRELQALVKHERLKLAAEPFAEEMSAKGPGRPVFTEMLTRIERGDANALLCWDIDRLYRNPVDEGRVRWLLQRRVIREIRTPFRTYLPQDAGLLMGVEGGKATDHIITLRKGVFRGFRGKLVKGWRPGPAPPGYLNDTSVEKGERTVIPDPERFPLIRRAWDLVLQGSHSIGEIHTLATEKWGLTSRKTKRLGGKPYSVSTWYRIFTDPFYYGYFWWKEPEIGVRKLYKGAHHPMITQNEFDRVQHVLGKSRKPAPQSHRFPFTGLMACGECGAAVTAEAKYQVICSECKRKFSALNRATCPRCEVAIDHMHEPTQLHYVYYHCTKRKDPTCSQKTIRVGELERQIDAVLARAAISDEFLRWVLKALRDDESRTDLAKEDEDNSRDRRRGQIERQLAHINAMILSPDTDWELISREEVKDEKLRLFDQLASLKSHEDDQGKQGAASLELSERTFTFAAYARYWLRQGDPDQKRSILAALGSNLTLLNRNLTLELRKPLRYVEEMANDVPAIRPGFEDRRKRSTNTKSPTFTSAIPRLRRGMNDVRTWWSNNPRAGRLPMLRPGPPGS